jgi:hypothetical protein
MLTGARGLEIGSNLFLLRELWKVKAKVVQKHKGKELTGPLPCNMISLFW